MKYVLLLMLLSLSLRAQAQESRTLTVFAATSLTNAFEALASAFEAANPGVDVLVSLGNSSSLAAQIVAGAPADVFASADLRQMQVVRRAGELGGVARVFARNRLVLLLPADNPARIRDLSDLSRPGIRLVLVAPGAPVRNYAEIIFSRLATDPAYGEDYQSAVLANLVSEEDNVRQVVTKIALGEADAGFAYTSDLTPDLRDLLLSVVIPDELNVVARYFIAITRAARDPALAQAFIDYVLSRDGQHTLVCWGFSAVRSDQPSSCQA